MNAHDQIEPGARIWSEDTVKLQENPPGEHDIMLSIAISMKRIADALTGNGPSILTAPINSYGEGIGEAIQGQMIRGQRGIDQYEARR